MKKEKAMKYLKCALETREHLRSNYVELMKDPIWRNLDNDNWLDGNPFQAKVKDIRNDLKEVNERIAKYERIVK